MSYSIKIFQIDLTFKTRVGNFENDFQIDLKNLFDLNRNYIRFENNRSSSIYFKSIHNPSN